MYYVLWCIGLIAACMLSAIVGLWVERDSGEKESSNK